MKEIYAWVPWFQELTKKIADGGEEYLAACAKKVYWGNSSALLNYGDENIDPFSFMYFLASKNTANQRAPVYQSVGEVFDIDSGDILSEKSKVHGFIFPKPPPHGMHLFHDGKNSNPSLLWKLFRQAASGRGAVEADAFHEALQIGQVGAAKLTQCLFLINPTEFMPMDEGIFEHHEALGLPRWKDAEKQINQQNGWENYQAMLGQFTSVFGECSFYEINTALYKVGKWKKEGTPIAAKCFQVSTNVYNDSDDYWSEFSSENHVRTGGPSKKYHLSAPSKGDVMLVRYGTLNGRAIGIVYENGYAEGWASEKSVHVLWLNKFSAELDGQTGRLGFSPTKKGTFLAFANTAQYKSTFELLRSLRDQEPDLDNDSTNGNGENDMKSVPLNQIFYGPPGTGKTYHTVIAALEALDKKSYRDASFDRDAWKGLKKRFDAYKKEGRIGFVTFHQSFGYEEFVEGIRPSVDDESENVSYAIRDGIFKRMCAHTVNAKSSARFEDAIESLQDECTEKPAEILTVAQKRTLILQYMPEREVFEILSKAGAPDSLPGRVSVERLRRSYESPTQNRGTRIEAIFNRLKTKHGLIEEQASKQSESRVLIIDEINRGNISRIFGELITLIEESKRLGNKEAASVDLSYSGDSFGVPNNLYIIGTMNTADRSIALLDTALRRRFRFVEMMPDLDLLKGVTVGDIDIDIKELLTKMNERTYFLRLKKQPDLDTLADIFQHEVLPLLQEYFYDDWEKINLVLNNNKFIQYTSPSVELTDAVGTDKRIWSINAKVFKDPSEHVDHYLAIYDNAARDRLKKSTGDGNDATG